MDLPRPPGARNDHLSDLPLHPAGSRLERAGGIFHPALPGGTLPALSAGGVYHSSLPVARTRPSRQVRVFIVPGSRLYAGWRLRLTRPTGSSHRLKPRRPAQAQRRRARYQARYLYRRVAATPYPAYRGLSQALTSQARAGAAPPGMRRFTSRLPDGYRTPPSPPPAPLR